LRGLDVDHIESVTQIHTIYIIKKIKKKKKKKKTRRKKGRKNHTCVGEKERRSSTMRKAEGKRKINSGRVGVRRKKREENEYFSEV
jgi:hypothetical protein